MTLLDETVGTSASLFHPNAPAGDPLLFSEPTLMPWADFTNSNVDPVFPEATAKANRRAPQGPTGPAQVFSSSDLTSNPSFDKAASKADKAARAAGVNPFRPGSILGLAETQLGAPYIFGDLDPVGGGSSGLDCSGLTKYVFGRLGVDLPHSAAQQSAMFAKISRANLQPGDLIFYQYGRLGTGGQPGNIDHVAIYQGNGMQIAASSGAGQVVDSQTVDWAHFMWGGRVPGLSGGSVAGPSGGQGQGGMTGGGSPVAPPLLAPAIAYGTQPDLAQVALKVRRFRG